MSHPRVSQMEMSILDVVNVVLTSRMDQKLASENYKEAADGMDGMHVLDPALFHIVPLSTYICFEANTTKCCN